MYLTVPGLLRPGPIPKPYPVRSRKGSKIDSLRLATLSLLRKVESSMHSPSALSMIFVTLAGCVSLACATPEENDVNPGFDLVSLRPPGFAPRVTGLAPLSGDRLAIATWRPNEIWILSGYHGPLAGMKARKAMGGFHE